MILPKNTDFDHCTYPVEVQNRSCPLGCRQRDELLFQAQDRLHGLPGIFKIVQCGECGLIRTTPQPAPHAIGYYYPENYGPFIGTKIKEDGRKPKLGRAAALIMSIFDLYTQKLPDTKPGRMLEIGCASGAFLHKMHLKGWQATGIELSDWACANARSSGFEVHCCSIENAPDPLEPYDLIVGWMVLEHLHDPISVLRRLRSWLKTDGWMVLSVPNSASFEFRLFQKRWYALQVPGHLFHFSPGSLKKVLSASGWRIKKIFHQRLLSNLVASTGYFMEDHGIANRIAKTLIDFPEKARFAQYALFPVSAFLGLLGQTGRMTIWARRI